MDKGFLFNVKNLTINPSKLVNEYINGKRKNIYNPVAFLIISVTIYLVLDSLIDIKYDSNFDPAKSYLFGYEVGKFVKLYFKYFWILSIVWLSISTKLIFKKHNYAEHLAINSFIIGQATLIGAVGLIIFKVPLLLNPIIYISATWLLYEIFKRKKRDLEIFGKSFGSIVLFFSQLVIILILIGLIIS